MNKQLDDLALEFTCGYCHAEWGKWCSTTSGARTYYLHAVRTEPLRAAFLLGYEQGRLG